MTYTEPTISPLSAYSFYNTFFINSPVTPPAHHCQVLSVSLFTSFLPQDESCLSGKPLS